VKSLSHMSCVRASLPSRSRPIIRDEALAGWRSGGSSLLSEKNKQKAKSRDERKTVREE